MWTNILNNVDYAEEYRENIISIFRYGKKTVTKKVQNKEYEDLEPS
jgi:hypothetical protein